MITICIGALYWSVLFNGDYDKDQNAEMIRDLANIFRTINRAKSGDWINDKKTRVLDMQNFSDKGLLLMEKVVGEERVPKAIIRSFICQYILSKTYPRMFDVENEDTGRISVFHKEAKDLEAHHIIPLGSVSTIGESTKALRNNDISLYNSPLNFVYITKADNLAIGAKSLQDYATHVKQTAMSVLCIQRTFANVNFADENSVKDVLENRYNTIRGEIVNRIDQCIAAWI